MKIAIFSDLHLSRDRPEATGLFADLLLRLGEDHPEPANELWLLGDVFDLMIGPFDGWLALYPDVFAALSKLKKIGWRILWIQGNHDFYLDDLFIKLGFETSDSEAFRHVNGKKVYLAHGDLVNQNDEKYLKWRAWTRSSRFQRAIRWLHNSVGVQGIEKLGLQFSRRSRKKSQSFQAAPVVKALYRSFAETKFHEGYRVVVLGHTHIEEDWQKNEAQYLNLGSWINYSPRYALWDTEIDNFPKLRLS